MWRSSLSVILLQLCHHAILVNKQINHLSFVTIYNYLGFSIYNSRYYKKTYIILLIGYKNHCMLTKLP